MKHVLPVLSLSRVSGRAWIFHAFAEMAFLSEFDLCFCDRECIFTKMV